MADVLTKKQRSYNMACIKSKNTGPELVLRKLLSQSKVSDYKLHYKIFGRPDLAFPKKRLAVFIDGCFWHKCPLCFVKPTSRIEFWKEKIRNNIKRDKQVNKFLKKNDWKFLRIWEHELKKNPEKTCQKIVKQLK
jgi:DNA mismatch endonuclease (patch repair protein)